jgi:hypothetical protein
VDVFRLFVLLFGNILPDSVDSSEVRISTICFYDFEKFLNFFLNETLTSLTVFQLTGLTDTATACQEQRQSRYMHDRPE